MRKSPFYYEKCDEYSIPALLDIQAEILETTLHNETKKEYGFLSYIVCEKTILASMKLDLVRTAVRKRSQKVTGLAIGMSPLIANHIGYLYPIVKECLNHYSYPCFVQLCVDLNNRKKKIATELLRQLEYETRRQNFEAIVIDLKNNNEVGQAFLVANGFNLLFSNFSSHINVFSKKL